MVSRACKAICTEDIGTLGQSYVTELFLYFLGIPGHPVWRGLVSGDTGRVSMELALPAPSRSLALLRTMMPQLCCGNFLLPGFSLPIASAKWKEFQHKRGPLPPLSTVPSPTTIVSAPPLFVCAPLWLCLPVPHVVLALSIAVPALSVPWKSCGITGCPPPWGWGEAWRGYILTTSQHKCLLLWTEGQASS